MNCARRAQQTCARRAAATAKRLRGIELKAKNETVVQLGARLAASCARGRARSRRPYPFDRGDVGFLPLTRDRHGDVQRALDERGRLMTKTEVWRELAKLLGTIVPDWIRPRHPRPMGARRCSSRRRRSPARTRGPSPPDGPPPPRVWWNEDRRPVRARSRRRLR